MMLCTSTRNFFRIHLERSGEILTDPKLLNHFSCTNLVEVRMRDLRYCTGLQCIAALKHQRRAAIRTSHCGNPAEAVSTTPTCTRMTKRLFPAHLPPMLGDFFFISETWYSHSLKHEKCLTKTNRIKKYCHWLQMRLRWCACSLVANHHRMLDSLASLFPGAWWGWPFDYKHLQTTKQVKFSPFYNTKQTTKPLTLSILFPMFVEDDTHETYKIHPFSSRLNGSTLSSGQVALPSAPS